MYKVIGRDSSLYNSIKHPTNVLKSRFSQHSLNLHYNELTFAKQTSLLDSRIVLRTKKKKKVIQVGKIAQATKTQTQVFKYHTKQNKTIIKQV